MAGEYFTTLTQGIVELLRGILKEDSFTLFRRSPEVVAGLPLTEASSDYHLYFAGKQILEKDQGSFTVANGDGSFSVFRNPVPMQASFVLLANGMLAQNRLRVYDRLVNHLFDHSRIDPILPESYKKNAGLYERLSSEKAELSVQGDLSGASTALSTTGTGLDVLRLVVVYRALYHSGSLLREENRVKTRVIEYNRKTE